MGSPSISSQPAAPDYAAANREGIITDIETLPLRRQIENAARLGKDITYVDPKSGEQRTVSFEKLGDQEYARQMTELLSKSNEDLQRSQLNLRKDIGEENARQTAKEIEAADPKGWAARQQILDRVTKDLDMGPATVAPSANIASAENRLWNIANAAPEADSRLGELYGAAASRRDARLGDIYREAQGLPGQVSDSSTAALNQGLQQAMAEYKLGGKLDEATRRDLLNEVRAGQVARGNYLGDAAAVVEATELGKAANELKQQRLANLLDIQNRAFGQNTTLRQEGTQNQFNRLGTLAGLQGQDFGQDQSRTSQLAALAGQDVGQRQGAYQTGLGAAQAAFQGTQAMAGDQRAARQEGFGYDQQRLANAQSAALGAPLTNQFGSLQGAQQGAVGFTPVNFTPGLNLNQGAGAQAANYAQGLYGTQANMWNQQAQIQAQGNPWMSLLGNVAGAAAGAGMAAMFA